MRRVKMQHDGIKQKKKEEIGYEYRFKRIFNWKTKIPYVIYVGLFENRIFKNKNAS